MKTTITVTFICIFTHLHPAFLRDTFAQFKGGISDGKAMIAKLDAKNCILPNYSNVSIGGNSDGHAMIAKLDAKNCTLPSYSNVSIGGNSDGSAMIAKTDVKNCTLPSYANISIGGNADGHAFLGSSSCLFVNICSVKANAGNDTAICLGNSLKLTAGGGVKYSWSTKDSTASITVSPVATTTYTVSVSNDTCANKDSIKVIVDTIAKANITGNTNLCKGDTAVLTVSGGNTFLWNTGDTTNTIIVETDNYPSLPKDTTFNVKITNGVCFDSSSVTIKINPLPIAVIAGTNKLCKGQNTTLTAKGGKTYLWNTGDTTASIIIGTQNFVSLPKDTIYTIAISDGTCKNTTSFTVTVNAGTPPVATITGNKTVCAGNSTVLAASGGDTYLWNTKDTIKTITTTPNADTTYTVIISNSSCSSSESVKIKVNTLPTVDAGKDVTITSGNKATLSATGAVVYTWEPTTGLSNDTIRNPTVSPTTTTTYIVTGTDANGCANSDTMMVIVIEKDSCGEMFIPNAFSPNDNSFNDVFRVRMSNNCLKEIHFIIYDRWGEKLFETEDITKGWDGNYNGKALNTGVFVYYVRATLTTDEVVEQKGSISLIR